MSREKTYEYVVWQDESIWTAHSPSIPGVYGLGETKARAARDLMDAIDTLFDYLHEIGETPPKPKRVSSGAIRVAV